jgi:hypothetical protein
MTKATRWPVAAALWATGYGLLALHWAVGGAGFPFGHSDPDPGIAKGMSILSYTHRESAAPVIAAGMFAAAAVALVLVTRPRARAAEGHAVTIAAFLGVVLPDDRPLVAIGHLPILLAGKPFDWPRGASLSSQLPWPVLNQFVCIGGAVLFALAALAHRRARTGACADCGRGAHTHDPARWGRIAVWTAVLIPAVYAATRWAWALGVPFGFSTAQLRQLDREMPGIWWAGAALGSMALLGAWLTIGLIRPWGEVFPRWIPVLRGRRVPVMVAVIPALGAALVITSAGLMMTRILLTHPSWGNWAAMGPAVLWPFWGAALAAAAVAYRARRRGPCATCGASIALCNS